MAVKRVIMQHFSMKYDYMTKERPNIYQPSRSKQQQQQQQLHQQQLQLEIANDDDNDENETNNVKLKMEKDSSAIQADEGALSSSSLSSSADETSADQSSTNDGSSGGGGDVDEEISSSGIGSSTSSSNNNSNCSNSSADATHTLMAPPPTPPSSSSSSSNWRNKNDKNTSMKPSNDDIDDYDNAMPMQRSLDTKTNNALLDSIIEMKEKLPDTYKLNTNNKKIEIGSGVSGSSGGGSRVFGRGSQYSGVGASRNGFKTPPQLVVPTDNWRYRGGGANNNSTMAYYRSNNSSRNAYENVPFNGGRRPRYHHGQSTTAAPSAAGYNSYHSSTIKSSTSPQEIRNWRNECMNNTSSRTCGMAASASSSAASAILSARSRCGQARGSLMEDRRGSDASDVGELGVGLSPPSESLLMQRRQRLNSRASDIGLTALGRLNAAAQVPAIVSG